MPRTHAPIPAQYDSTPESPHAIYELPRARGGRRGTVGTRTVADRLRVAGVIARRDYSLTVWQGAPWSADRIARIAARNAFLAAR